MNVVLGGEVMVQLGKLEGGYFLRGNGFSFKQMGRGCVRGATRLIYEGRKLNISLFSGRCWFLTLDTSFFSLHITGYVCQVPLNPKT